MSRATIEATLRRLRTSDHLEPPMNQHRLRSTLPRFRSPHARLASPFGTDRFGMVAEWFARAFGTPYFLVGQTTIVLAWIAWNVANPGHFDPYPFILLNLAFSLQAAYAAPLILLAETREADRDHARAEADATHRQSLADTTLQLLEQNTELTRQVAELTRTIHDLTEQIHRRVVTAGGGGATR
jgi:uncharacterized membrane protein